jgi:hypothetical protein
MIIGIHNNNQVIWQKKRVLRIHKVKIMIIEMIGGHQLRLMSKLNLQRNWQQKRNEKKIHTLFYCFKTNF